MDGLEIAACQFMTAPLALLNLSVVQGVINMLTVEQSVLINKPVDQVWNFLTDFKNTPKWDIGVNETRQTSQGAARLGTTFQNIGPFLGQQSVREYKVTEYEPDKKATVKLITPSLLIKAAEVSYIFESAQNGTKLSAVGSVEFNGLFKVFRSILLQRARKDSEGDLANLKRLLEAQTDPA
jgi:carbon monoxide dehydrogenase subunit G